MKDKKFYVLAGFGSVGALSVAGMLVPLLTKRAHMSSSSNFGMFISTIESAKIQRICMGAAFIAAMGLLGAALYVYQNRKKHPVRSSTAQPIANQAQPPRFIPVTALSATVTSIPPTGATPTTTTAAIAPPAVTTTTNSISHPIPSVDIVNKPPYRRPDGGEDMSRSSLLAQHNREEGSFGLARQLHPKFQNVQGSNYCSAGNHGDENNNWDDNFGVKDGEKYQVESGENRKIGQTSWLFKDTSFDKEGYRQSTLGELSNHLKCSREDSNSLSKGESSEGRQNCEQASELPLPVVQSVSEMEKRKKRKQVPFEYLDHQCRQRKAQEGMRSNRSNWTDKHSQRLNKLRSQARSGKNCEIGEQTFKLLVQRDMFEKRDDRLRPEHKDKTPLPVVQDQQHERDLKVMTFNLSRDHSPFISSQQNKLAEASSTFRDDDSYGGQHSTVFKENDPPINEWSSAQHNQDVGSFSSVSPGFKDNKNVMNGWNHNGQHTVNDTDFNVDLHYMSSYAGNDESNRISEKSSAQNNPRKRGRFGPCPVSNADYRNNNNCTQSAPAAKFSEVKISSKVKQSNEPDVGSEV